MEIDEEEIQKWVYERIHELWRDLDKETALLAALFTVGWWKAYGAGPFPTLGDIALGVSYAIIIPKAFQGGDVANTFAITALGVLGFGLLSDSQLPYLPGIR